MSVITVYRTFFWNGSRLMGQTAYIWETKEQQARCIKEDTSTALMSGLKMALPSIPPTEQQQRNDARYHIERQQCLCGIFGYFSPTYLSLVMSSGNGPGAVDCDGETVFARIRLGGLVDIHGMGARGEFGLIEEAWYDGDDGDTAEAIAKQYDIPVNQSDYELQPRTDPILSGEAKIVKLSPLFAGMPEAMAMQNSLGGIPGPAAGIQTTITQKMINQARATPGNAPPMVQLFGQPLTFKQYMAVMSGQTSPTPNPFGNLAGNPLGAGPFPPSAPGGLTPTPGLQPGGTVTGRLAPGGPPPAWTSQKMRRMWNASAGGPPAACSAPPGTNCQCGACAFLTAMVPSASGIGAPGLWKCPICGRYETKATNHTWRNCHSALPQIVPVPGPIGPDMKSKPGIITRIKRALTGWEFWS